MPLTKTGHEVMSSMQKEYGSKKGKEVFYASVNAKKSGSSKWEGKPSKDNYSKDVVSMASEMRK